MSDTHAGYRFGDVTRMVVAWLGPNARAVRGKIDWVKFGKALVVGFLTTGTVTFVSTAGAFVGAVRDPDWATGIPALLGVIVFAIEQVRRILQHKPADVPPFPVTSEDPRSAQPQESPAQGPIQGRYLASQDSVWGQGVPNRPPQGGEQEDPTL